MQIRPTAFTIGLIIYSFIALFAVYTEFGIDSIMLRLIFFMMTNSSSDNSSEYS